MEDPLTVALRKSTLVVAAIMIVAAPALAQNQAPRLEGHACAPMRWEASEGRPRIALSTPVRVNGRRYWFQFDTAAWPSMLYGDEADRRGWTSPSDVSIRARSFEAGGVTFEGDRALISIRRDMRRGNPGGTLGLSALMGKLTVIDYRAMRLCILPRTADVAFAREASWTPLRLRRGSPRIAIQIGEQTFPNMIFDTGSSMFPLLVDLPLWTRLTGHAAPSEAPIVEHGTAWGRPKSWRGAPTQEPITIGDVVSRGANVFIDESNPTGRFAEMEADGILGNALLWNHVVLLDLRDFVSDEEWARAGAGAQRQARFGIVD
jgi:hypothetical protein